MVSFKASSSFTAFRPIIISKVMKILWIHLLCSINFPVSKKCLSLHSGSEQVLLIRCLKTFFPPAPSGKSQILQTLAPLNCKKIKIINKTLREPPVNLLSLVRIFSCFNKGNPNYAGKETPSFHMQGVGYRWPDYRCT